VSEDVAMTGTLVQEFLEFIDAAPGRSVAGLSARVLLKCRRVTNAEAGSIFILRGRGAHRRLEATSLQNDAVRTRSALFVIPIDPNSIAGHVAATGETVFIDDVEAIDPALPYRFNRAFDERTGYRTQSILCFPLSTLDGKVIGVVQLINSLAAAEAGGRPRPIPFARHFADLVAPVSQIVGRVIERAAALEQIAERNRRLALRNQQLQAERERVEALSHETEQAFMMSVELLARAAEVHDQDTGNHIMRVNEYSFALAGLAALPQALCAGIHWAAALHDVGKMSVDQAVLHKRGPLDKAEWAAMKAHTLHGYAILSGHPKLALAAEIAHCHHEMWAGGGYPRGLSRDEIPVAARIVALADVYDALRSARPYKAGFDHERAVGIMLEGDERMRPAEHFDPALLTLFAEHHGRFAEIWDGFQTARPEVDGPADET
jgi:HD-GYP domain-containing protein (c-di-GMP phosphodiesterase class II)